MTIQKKTTKKVNAQHNDALANYRASINAAFEARIEEEKRVAKNEQVLANKIAKIKSYQDNVSHDSVLAFMLRANIDTAFITAKHRKDAMCDIYRVQRVTQLARAFAKAESIHHYMRAILLTAKAFKDANLELTEDEVKSACSLDVHSRDAAKEAHVVKYQKHVDASTVSSQHASSAFALVMFNVLKKTQNAARKDVYTLQDNELTRELLSIVA